MEPVAAPYKPITELSRAQGCLLGQLAGDSLGSLVEFRSPESIQREYPAGVRNFADSGTWDTIAGQPTDDSEMALALARVLAQHKKYDPTLALDAYIGWLNSGPFDCGSTIRRGLQGERDWNSQANGAMMRISPLGIFGANYDFKQVAEWASEDAALTHPHPVCRQANSLYASAIACAVRSGCGPGDLYKRILIWAERIPAESTLMSAIEGAATAPPAEYMHQQGWVLTAFRNALWQLLHTDDLEEAVVDTIRRGGDTDTNAAICGALLGAVYGREAVPKRWVDVLLSCRPMEGDPDVRRPRPACYWPVDALELAERLIQPP